MTDSLHNTATRLDRLEEAVLELAHNLESAGGAQKDPVSLETLRKDVQSAGSLLRQTVVAIRDGKDFN